jgi:hypothetical protein
MPSLRELEGWMTTAQDAQAAGRSRQGIINLAKNGRVRAVQVGQAYDTGRSVWIFDPESVKEFAHKEQKRGGVVVIASGTSPDRGVTAPPRLRLV